jgi:hypothetical protein
MPKRCLCAVPLVLGPSASPKRRAAAGKPGASRYLKGVAHLKTVT